MKRIIPAIIMSAALVLVLFGTTLAATVGLRDQNGASEIWVKPCTVFEVDLYLDLTSNEIGMLSQNLDGLTGYSIGILWDPLVELTGLAKGDRWSILDPKKSNGDPLVVPPSWCGDRITLYGYNFGAPIAQSNTFATLTLHCLAPGDTALVPRESIPDFSLALASFQDLTDITTVNFQPILIHQTPVPGALLLLGSGVAGLIGLRRRFRK
ncbi:MAG: hypothetical protein V1736_06745 [Pseudomonadota bacterium]